MSKTIQELSQLISGTVVGDGSITIQGITNIENPKAGFIAFIQDTKRLKALEETEIACLIAPKNITESSKPLILVENPKLAWARLLNEFHPPRKPKVSISSQAFISESATVGSGVTIEAFAVVSDGAQVGNNSVIRSHVHLGENVRVGENSTLHSGVKIYADCVIGNNVIIHSGTIIGTDGFGYVHTAEGQLKVPQVGNVVIKDDVELGASVTIDCATVGSTVIGKGCKIDNLVQIAHNVEIGEHTVISAETGISGSCKIGSHVTMGGKAGLGDHVEIGDWTIVGAGAGFPSGKKVPAKQIVFGQPARPYHEARKQIAAQLRSAETLAEVKKLRKKVAELETQLAATKA